MDKVAKVEDLKNLRDDLICRFDLQRFLADHFDSKKKELIILNLFQEVKSRLSNSLFSVEAILNSSLTFKDDDLTADVFHFLVDLIDQCDDFLLSFTSSSDDNPEGGIEDA